MQNLIINEIFYSIQGESLNIGIPTVFVRLTGCPLRCGYCDTSYAFNEGLKMTFNDILDKIKSYDCANVTVTGGEPLSQKKCFSFLDTLNKFPYKVSLETSNAVSIQNINKNIAIILDIKTPGSGESSKNIIENYQHLKNTDQIKFVICNLADYEWTRKYISQYNLHKICNILLSPSFGEMDIKVLAENILKDKLPVRLQTQLHKIIWGDERGR
tara:strand:- start:86 stop:727 length:642 start_codon:yes stop_codon:yes gene_type:complete